MEDTNNTIFTHAKMEYTSQLIDNITPQMFDGIKSIYDESKVYHKSHSDKSIVVIFRTFLEKVPIWSNEILEAETERIIQMSDCDWLDDLITAVFISHTKILTSIGSNNNANIDLTIPKTINFIHKSYINIAREIWKNPYLFDDNLIGSDYQKNMRTIELIIKECIENTIRKLLPIKEILRQHLDTYETNNTEIKRRNNTNELRELLVNELKNLSILPSQKEDENNSSEEEPEHDPVPPVEEPDPDPEPEPEPDHMPVEESGPEPVEEPGPEPVEEPDPVPVEEPENTNKEEENTGYISPDEDEIKDKCDGLTINDIPDITEEKNNNIDKIDTKEEKIDKVKILSTYMDSIEKEKESNIEELTNEKINNTPLKKEEDPIIDDKKETFNIPGFDLLQKFNSKSEDIDEPIIKEPEPEREEIANNIQTNESIPEKEIQSNPENIIEEKKEAISEIKEIDPEENNVKVIKNESIDNIKEKEIISILKQDIPDDAQTIDNFFDDVSSLMERKNITVNKETNKYTLFDDAIDE